MTLPSLVWPNPAVGPAITPGMQGLLTGQKTVADVLNDMDAAWNRNPATESDVQHPAPTQAARTSFGCGVEQGSAAEATGQRYPPAAARVAVPGRWFSCWPRTTSPSLP